MIAISIMQQLGAELYLNPRFNFLLKKDNTWYGFYSLRYNSILEIYVSPVNNTEEELSEDQIVLLEEYIRKHNLCRNCLAINRRIDRNGFETISLKDVINL